MAFKCDQRTNSEMNVHKTWGKQITTNRNFPDEIFMDDKQLCAFLATRNGKNLLKRKRLQNFQTGMWTPTREHRDATTCWCTTMGIIYCAWPQLVAKHAQGIITAMKLFIGMKQKGLQPYVCFPVTKKSVKMCLHAAAAILRALSFLFLETQGPNI